MEYTLTRAKRKTITMIIRKDLRIDVRAPMRMPAAEIEAFVRSHEGWAAKQLRQLKAAAEATGAFAYADGDSIPFRGGALILGTGREHKPVVQEDRLLLPAGDRRNMVAEFLREQARMLIQERLAVFAPRMGVTPAGVKITSARTRWGSCSGRDKLCFAYRVACLPPELLDYIVVHELAHIREHNHSPRFWAVVEQVLPDWSRRRKELRAFGNRLPF